MKAWGPESEEIYILTERSDRQTSPYTFHSIGTISGARTLAVPQAGAHVLVLTEDGHVWAWGNDRGQLGNPGILAGNGWTKVDNLEEVAAVAAGALHSVALKRDGTVWTWGWNDQGQLGDGTLVNRALPGVVPGLSAVRMVAADGAFTLALRMDGTVWAFGTNWTGIVPGEPRRSILEPLQVGGLTGVEAIAAYQNRGYAKDDQGQVWIWGKGPAGEPGDPRLLSASELGGLAAPLARQLGLIDRAAAVAWDWPGNGQRNRTVRVAGSSLEVRDAATENRYSFEGAVVDVASGWAVGLITASGVRGPSIKTAKSVVAETDASAKLPAAPAGSINDLRLQPAAVTGAPKPLAAASDPPLSPWERRLTAGGNQSLAVKSDGTLWGWGMNDVGQLCDGTTTQHLAAVQSMKTGVTQVVTSTNSAGSNPPHTLILASDRSVWGCGDNSFGQLGNGTTGVNSATPVQATGLTGVLAVAVGIYHSIALKSDGTVWGWGSNDAGQVGDGTTTNRTTPVQVTSLTGVVAISAGYQHNMALKSDGTVWTWGYNGYGQLGNGGPVPGSGTTNSPVPIQVPGLTGVVAIAAGEDHTLVLKNDGTVWGWGDAHFGQLGSGTNTGINTSPVQAMNLTNVIALAAGDYHTLAIDSNGSVWAFGLNAGGQVGNGSNTDQHVPVQVTGLTGAVAIAGGAAHSLALKSDGTIWAWGDNTNGQLGNGTSTASNVPVMSTSGFAPVPRLPPALRFIPVTPCRVADTRNPPGPFGGPALSGGTSRDFVIPSSACGIPATAAAYALNVTVVPSVPLGFLTVYPTGVPLPVASTLNSWDGRVKANAAIVPAGTGGAVSVYPQSQTDVILDINGYFVPPSDASYSSALAFFTLTPCRIADTRTAAGPLGGPFLAANQTRAFPVLASTCNVPSTALAYSLNFTVVPHRGLGHLTTWPAGQSQPLASTLNSWGGQVTANAGIVPAGTAGQIDVFASDDTDLVIDINGYFAPAAPGGLSLYDLTPCRVLDTRNPSGSPPFNGTQTTSVFGSLCGADASAQALVFNATVVPAVPLGHMTLWPEGQPQPVVSTLNSWDGIVTSNMAIVPATNGSISEFVTSATHLILDISGYFAP